MPSSVLCELFGIDLPVVQAPMAGSGDERLAAAVSTAGALGSVPAAMLTAEQLDGQLARLRQRTDRSYNVNFFVHRQPVADDRLAAVEERWIEVLAPYLAEFGVDPATVVRGQGRVPFSAEMAEVVAAHRPAVVSFHFGLPSAVLLDIVRAAGAKVMSSATTVEEAVWLEARGVDVVIAQGLEAGGHRGHFLGPDLDVSTQMPTATLLPAVVAAVRCPVIAAGGIAGASDLARAMTLGASGVQCGTSFLLCDEATTSAVHRAALLKGTGDGTVSVTELTNLFTGRPARGIRNRLMRDLGPLRDDVPPFPLASAFAAPLRAAAEARSSGDFSPLWAGENRSGCAAVAAAEIVRRLGAGLAGDPSVQE